MSPRASCRARHKVTMGGMNESGQVSGKGLHPWASSQGLSGRPSLLWTLHLSRPLPAPHLVPGAGLIAEQFLETTAAQLTYHGLCELTAAAKEGELSVFFRNNHFSTMTKHKVRRPRAWGAAVPRVSSCLFLPGQCFRQDGAD